MRFFHLSDLHLGKRVKEFSMLEEQRDVLSQIVEMAKSEGIDAVVVAGDVYDKAMPPVEATQLLDDFLVALNRLGVAIFIIPGNHDNAERMAFGAEFLKISNVHIGTYVGKFEPLKLEDEFGEIYLWLLPYLKPSTVRKFFPDKEIGSYTEAISTVLESAEIDQNKRNIIVAHQFITGAKTSESEEFAIGGIDNISGKLFGNFDYVALGHLHRPQNMKSSKIRYCGTPLKYSLSEIDHVKSVTLVNAREKGDIEISELPLTPKNDMREIVGTFEELSNSNFGRNDYVSIKLTDEEPNARAKLRLLYPKMLSLEMGLGNKAIEDRTAETLIVLENKTALDLINDFFQGQNGKDMNSEQSEYVKGIFEELRDETY
ncbi:MAG: exonuclease SbcCD subunit D [Turicibacter sp.]|nr:exonuclease SbcCD subunit D [Turicibacter sp.]